MFRSLFYTYAFILLAQFLVSGNAFPNFLYYPASQEYPLATLPNGDNEYLIWHLDNPLHFYSEKYDQLYINTNGILTFNAEFSEYINQPFPLEYPCIAPFYSNVDTTAGNESSSISIFTTQDPNQLREASEMVQHAFAEKTDFEATDVIVATWEKVGYYDSKADQLNTFQAVLIVDDKETFVQFIYPKDCLNWLKGENGPLGLPDIRAQAGFVAEDGRYLNLPGSGSDGVRFLSENSNIGIPGVWVYRVGPLNYDSNVEGPRNNNFVTEISSSLETCQGVGQRTCSQNAQCIDKASGFCCICRSGFYGNGQVCIKNDIPVRVTGSLMGELNGELINERSKLQSYIVTADGRSYTAVTPISTELGTNLRLALPIVTSIGWLFAKPLKQYLNGYQLSGGELLHAARLSFSTGEVLLINQTFEGLNYWDQLSVKVDLHGRVPHVNHRRKLHMSEFSEEYEFLKPNELHSRHAHVLEIPDENRVINFQLEQKIYFERCWAGENAKNPEGLKYMQKISKIMLDYFEKDRALRTSILAVVGVNATSNACTDGTAICSENMVCIPYEDTYRCDCVHGFTPQVTALEVEQCVDIDECALGTHVCDEKAMCINNQGGFSCVCFEGFEGNGFKCFMNLSLADNIESPVTVINAVETKNSNHRFILDNNNQENFTTPTPVYQEASVHQVDNCYRCSPYADCWEGHCVCREGFSGDGLFCVSNCPTDEIWEKDGCIKLPYESDVQPRCNFLGQCTCEVGYEFTEDGEMCRFVGHLIDESKSDELVPCDVEFNCHLNATCDWYEMELRHKCSCKLGYYGDGYHCSIIDDSCVMKPEVCDSQATCSYNERLGRSQCQCKRGYEGDGIHCAPAPECFEDLDCGLNAYCEKDLCQCSPGFERDMDDICVMAGSCGLVICGINAVCKYDRLQGVKYCDCMQGYEGDALIGCKSKSIPCNIQFNCGVHANCEPTKDPIHYECQCDAGYNGDGYICVEDENCLNSPHLCDMNAQCLSTNNGLVCACNKGFYGNGSFCLERQQHDSGFLMISQGVVIVRVPLNAKNVKPISVASMAIGLDKDCLEGRIYWGDISAKKIVSIKYDGTDMKTFITEDIESPEGIAVDCISRRIYWTDSIKDTVEVASLEDPSLHGTAREVLLGQESVLLPNSLVVLERTGELCYADAGTKKVGCIDAYTKKVRSISNELTYPFGLVYTHDHFYWTDWITKKLESVNTLGQRQKSLQIPFFGSHKMYAMTAIEDHCPQMDSPCQINNGGCSDSRLCLVNRKAPSGKSCKCTRLSKLCNAPSSFLL
uniref:Nidogen n=1 Tax=Glossina austeni TaxID=7395 RepID=A0A1A9V771_GLOAU